MSTPGSEVADITAAPVRRRAKPATVLVALLILALAAGGAALRRQNDPTPTPVAPSANAGPSFGMGSPAAKAGANGLILYVSPTAASAASPTGKGKASCTRAAPCQSIGQALDLAKPGGTIQLLGGNYAEQVLDDHYPQLDDAKENIVIEPAPGEQPVLIGLDIYPAHITVRDLDFESGPITVRARSKWTRIERVTVRGNAPRRNFGVVLGASHTAIIDSTLTGNVDEDELFIGGGGEPVTDVTVSGNRLGPARSGPLGGHVDCLQIATEASNVTITNNVFNRCANAGIILKADIGPISDVSITNNVLIGCGERVPECDGYYAVYLLSAGHKASNIRFLHNTVIGTVQLDPTIEGLRVSGNLMDMLNVCGPFEDHNVISRSDCKQLGPADVSGVPDYVDAAGGNYALKPGSPGAGLAGDIGVPLDAAGKPRKAAADAGAFEIAP